MALKTAKGQENESSNTAQELRKETSSTQKRLWDKFYKDDLLPLAKKGRYGGLLEIENTTFGGLESDRATRFFCTVALSQCFGFEVFFNFEIT